MNYRVEDPLWRVVVDWIEGIAGEPLLPSEIDTLLRFFLDWKAPERAEYGFDDVVLTGLGTGDDARSHHMNINSLYLQSDTRPDPFEQYIANDFLHVQNTFGSPTGEPNAQPLASSDSVDDASFNVTDGSFAGLGSVWNQIVSTTFPSTDSVLVNYWLDTFNDPKEILKTLWFVTGDAQVVADEDNSYAELVQTAETTIGQYVTVDENTVAVEFEVAVTAAGTDDVLEVRFADSVIASLPLRSLPTELTRYSVPLSRSEAEGGRLTFQVLGSLDAPATVQLDSIRLVRPVPSFSDIDAGLTGVDYSSADWGDYDNDGDLDILLTGTAAGLHRVSRVYRNNGGTFTDIGALLPGVHWGSAAWGDYDNDGDLDILLTGDNGPRYISGSSATTTERFTTRVRTCRACFKAPWTGAITTMTATSIFS